MLLENKVAIVTGGSRGIGYATVEAFLLEGAKVVLCASRQETADKAVAKLKEAYPEAAVEGIFPNLSDYEAVTAAFDDVAKKYGKIDILVNNAGVSESTPFTEYTDETFHKVMDLNLNGVFHCSKAVSTHMIAAGGGVILNTSSMVSRYGRTRGNRLPDFQVCGERFYPVSGKRAWAEGNPGQCGCAGYHLHGHDAAGSQRGD